MKNKISLFLWALCLPAFIAAQDPILDSLKAQLVPEMEEADRIDLLYEIADHLKEVDRAKAMEYVDQGLEVAERRKDEKRIATAYFHYAEIEYDNGNREIALDWADKALESAQNIGDRDLETNVYLVYTRIYEDANETQKALSAIEKAQEIAEQSGNDRLLGEAYHAYARLNHILDDPEKAESYLLKAIEIFEPLGDIRRLASLNQGLSVVKYGAEGLPYAEKAYDYFEQMGDLEGMAYSKSSAGGVYYQMDQFEKAIPYFQEAIELFEQIDLKVGISYTELNMGATLNQLERYEAAIPHFERSRDIATEYGYDDIKQLDFVGLAVAYSIRSNPQLVQVMLDSIQAIQDTLFNRERASLLVDANTRFETKEKEAQIAQQELEIERQTRLRNGIILGSLILLLIVGGIFQYFRNRQRLKRKETEMALQMEKAEAEKLRELDELKSSFFANVSHEFRTPLSLILGPVQSAREQIPASDDWNNIDSIPLPANHIQIIERNAYRLQTLVNQLLDLSKLEAGKMQLQVSPGNIIQLLRSIVFSFESLAEHKQVQFHTDFPKEINQAYFDSDKVEKIVVNLLSNAFKFTPEKGRVGVEVTTEEDKVKIEISDTGPGIATDDLPKIFDRFYQVEGNTDQGTGIGLALVKELVTLHKGELSVDSQPGQGTTFRISLPVARSYFEEKEISLEKRQKRETNPAVESLISIQPDEEVISMAEDLPIALVVEDNADLRIYITGILKGKYQIITAVDGVEGLEKAIQQVPDIIISDVMMPRMNGIDLCKQLKEGEKTSHIPVILLTAKAAQSDKIEGLETGADDYLTKPFDAKELKVRVKNLISQRTRLQEKFQSQLSIRPKNVEVQSVDDRFLQEVMTQIEANMSNEQYSVEDLAHAVSFSRSQLHRKLKAICDKSPNELIRDFRMTRAKELLEQKAGNISEIAFEVGYSNLSYFSRSFKKAFGIPPSEV